MRTLYRFLIRCYPRGFRERYEEELLQTFDDARGQRGGVGMLLDAAWSVLRRRMSPAVVARKPTPAAGLSLYVTPEATLRAAVMVPGALLSVAAFGLVGFAIVHGAPSGAMRLPRVVTASSNVGWSERMQVVPQAQTPGPAVSTGSATRTPQIVLRADPARRLTPAERAERIFALLDEDRDRRLSRTEREKALDPRLRRILADADSDADRFLTREEVLAALRSAVY